MLAKLVEGLFTDRLSAKGAANVVVECRRCGTSLDDGTEVCPYCGDTDTARFEI